MFETNCPLFIVLYVIKLTICLRTRVRSVVMRESVVLWWYLKDGHKHIAKQILNSHNNIMNI